jgi:hypothetical protein
MDDVPGFVVAADVPAHLGNGALFVLIVLLSEVGSFQNLLGAGLLIYQFFQE